MEHRMIFIYLILYLIVATKAQGDGQQHRRRHRISVTHRSIVGSHPEGGNRSCANEEIIKTFLPRSYRGLEESESKKHLHLLLAVSDNQLAFLINWLAVAFTFNYLPSPRVLIHFSCHGHLTRSFVEKFLLSECHPHTKRSVQGNSTSSWRGLIKDRLSTLLEIVLALDHTDAGAMTFDLDSIWIRNLVPVFDHFGHHYDFVSQGSMRENSGFGGRVITSFGAAYFKNSPASLKLALTTLDLLNSSYEPDMPDQDYVSRALFVEGKATQHPLPEFAPFTKTSEFANENCHIFPDTCTYPLSGVNGTFSLRNEGGAYLFLPQIVAPIDCTHVCSVETLLFQHCGISKCIPDEAKNASSEMHDVETKSELPCSFNPEFILSTNNVHKIMKDIPVPPTLQRARHGIFDVKSLESMVKQVGHFVDKSRAAHLCKVYGKICKDTGNGFTVSES